MKCLNKYKWVKLPRHLIPDAKGLLGAFLRLASRAAFRKGWIIYCSHQNPVEPGMWAGGIVGIKSITGIYDCRSVGLEAENIFQKVVTPSWEQEWHLGEVMIFGTDDLGEGFG